MRSRFRPATTYKRKRPTRSSITASNSSRREPRSKRLTSGSVGQPEGPKLRDEGGLERFGVPDCLRCPAEIPEDHVGRAHVVARGQAAAGPELEGVGAAEIHHRNVF